MSGLLAVLGGQEQLPGCEVIDLRLLAESGLRRPTVTVLAAATVPGRIGAKVREAADYWPRLGARVRVVTVDGQGSRPSAAGTAHMLDALTAPDLVVLTGGRPWRLQRHLTAPVRRRLFELHRDGVPLAGSSAGAMALCD